MQFLDFEQYRYYIDPYTKMSQNWWSRSWELLRAYKIYLTDKLILRKLLLLDFSTWKRVFRLEPYLKSRWNKCWKVLIKLLLFLVSFATNYYYIKQVACYTVCFLKSLASHIFVIYSLILKNKLTFVKKNLFKSPNAYCSNDTSFDFFLW